MKPLIQFNASYYRYPTSVSRGYWSRYPTDAGLSQYEGERRETWLSFASDVSQTEFGTFVSQRLSESSDLPRLSSYLHQHGIFAERFFIRAIRERISRRLAAPEIDLLDVARSFSGAWDQDVTGSERSLIVYWCAETVFDQVFLQLIDDESISGGIRSWYQKLSQKRTCQICHLKYRVVDLPDWIYHGSNGQQHCCFQCEIIEKPTKKHLSQLVPAFITSCGFIPRSDASPINYPFTSRIPEEDWMNVIKVFDSMGGIEHVKRHYGSWFIGLAESGALPEGVLATSRGIRCISTDGHTCHSLDEQVIDNWLFAHGVSHDREPMYPPHPQYNPNGRRRADWRVGDTYLEYFGLVGDSNYDAKIDEKIALACAKGIPLVALYPTDINRLDEALSQFLDAGEPLVT